MWDFSISKSVGMVLRTLPFIGLRLAVYLGIAVAYLLVTGTGAGIGYGVGHFWSSPDSPHAGALWGGLIGFGLTAGVLHLAREYLLYLVKAAHIAVLVEVMDNKPVPGGQGQIAYGTSFVKAHFGQTSILFAVDQVVKGVLRVITGTISAITAFLPVPALFQIVRFINAAIRMSLTYVDEIILAYLIRTRTANPWESAKDALILYAQNYKHFLKNAAWLSVFMWLITVLIFILLLGPAGAVAYFVPGNTAIWVFAFAAVFAVALKKALLEPFAVSSLMQVYFKTIEGQTPNAEWDQRLTAASSHFRALTGKASGWVKPVAPPQSPSSGPAPKPAT